MINAEKISETLENLKKNNTDPKTLLRKIRSLQKFLYWARQKGVIKKELFSELESTLQIEEIKLNPQGTKYTPLSHKTLKKLSDNPLINASSATINQRELNIPIPSHRYIFAALGLFLFLIAVAGFSTSFIARPTVQGQVLSAKTSVPRPLTFTGILKDHEGNAITYPTYVNLALYNSPTGSGAVYTSGKCFIRPTDAGAFSITVGVDCGAPVDGSLFGQYPDLFLGISVAGDRELAPRQKVATVGLAQEAQSVEGLKVGKDINSIPFIDKTGTIELTATASALRSTTADGNFTIGSAHTLTLESGGDAIHVKTSGQERAVINQEGNVGIGTLSPQGLLSVASNQFVVSASGNLDKVNGVAYSWPVLSGPPGSVLTNNGFGILSWTSPGGASATSGTLDFNQFSDTMTVDQPTTIHLSSSGLTIAADKNASLTVDLPSTGDFVIKNANSTFATFSHDGTFTLDSLKLVDNSITTTSGDLILNSATSTVNVKSAIKVNLTGAPTTNGLCHTTANGTSAEEIVDCSATPGDIAEWYAAKAQVEPGDIVATTDDNFSYNAQGADPLTGAVKSLGNQTIKILDKASTATQVVGIVSTGPYQVLGEDVKKGVESASDPNIRAEPLALAGRVPVKVSDEGGPIKAGDYLTLSSTPGVAMRASGPAVTIGKALEDWQPFSGKPTVLVLVYISWHDPQKELASGKSSWTEGFTQWVKKGVGTAGNDFTDAVNEFADYKNSLVDSFITARVIFTERFIAQKAIFQEATIEKLTAAQATIADTLRVGGKVISPVVETDQLTAKNVTADTIKAKSIQTDEIRTASDEVAVKLDNQEKGKLAALVIKGLHDTPVATVDAQGNASFAGTLTSREATISGTVTADRVDAANIRDLESRTNQLSDTSSKLDINLTDVQKLITQLRQDPLSDPSYYSAKLPQLSSEISGGQSNLSFSGKTNFYDVFITHSASVGTTYIDSEGISSLGQELRLTALSSVNILDGAVIISRDGTLTTEGAVVAKGGVHTSKIAAAAEGENIEMKLTSADNRNSKFVIHNSENKDVASVDSAGTATFKTINLSDQAAGTATMAISQDSTIVYNSEVHDGSLIYLTPTTEITAGQLAVIKKETCQDKSPSCRPYFEVSLGTAAHGQVKFQWLIVN